MHEYTNIKLIGARGIVVVIVIVISSIFNDVVTIITSISRNNNKTTVQLRLLPTIIIANIKTVAKIATTTAIS